MSYNPFAVPKPRAINVPAGYSRSNPIRVPAGYSQIGKTSEVDLIRARLESQLKLNIKVNVGAPTAAPNLTSPVVNVSNSVKANPLTQFLTNPNSNKVTALAPTSIKSAASIINIARLASRFSPLMRIADAVDLATNSLQPTISSEDEAAAIKRAQDKLLQAGSEPQSKIEEAVFPFTGGQSYGVLYNLTLEKYVPGEVVSQYTRRYQGRIVGINLRIEIVEEFSGYFQHRYTFQVETQDAQSNLYYGFELATSYTSTAQAQGFPPPYVKIISAVRADGQVDTGGNPPATSQPITSSPTSTIASPQIYQREIGDRQPKPLKNQIKMPSLVALKPEFGIELIPDLLIDDVIQPTPVREPRPRIPVLPPPVNDAAIDTAPRLGDVTTLFGPLSDPNTIKIVAPFGANLISPLPVGEPLINTGLERTPQPAPLPTKTPARTPDPEKTEIEKARQDLEKLITGGAAIAGLTPAIQQIANRANQAAEQTTPQALQAAAAAGTCQTTQPGGCTTRALDDAVGRVNQNTNQRASGLDEANALANAAQIAQLNDITSRIGAQLPGGLAGASTRLSRFLGIDRIFNLLNFLAILHNASMLSASLKVTLLETLSSVGNATGLLQTSEGDNVDLNQVFNQGIETFVVSLIGAEAYAGLKLSWRKYSSIYRAATNSLNAVSSMFNSIGQAVETAAEYTGKIGNAIRAAGVVRENAYNFMSERFEVRNSNKYMSFQSTVRNTIQVLETVNEIAENVVEGQQQYTEAVKATADFHKQLSEAQKNPGIDNKAVKEETEKIKANLIKDPTGEDEEGLLSFLTD